MNKKIIVTESQYDRLMKFINETPFDKVLTNVVRVGDIIRIEWGGKENVINNFKVIDSTNGQVIMDNIDSGSININFRYHMTLTSLHGDKLDISRVHKKKEKDKLQNIRSWQRVPVNNIKNIEVIRNGSVVDVVDTPNSKREPINKQNNSTKPIEPIKDKPSEEIPLYDNPKLDFKNKASDIILVFLDHIVKGNGLKIKTSKEEIDLCCIESGNSIFTFTLDSKNEALRHWTTFEVKFKDDGNGEFEGEDLYEMNKNIISTNDDGETFTIKFIVSAGKERKTINIDGILEVIPTETCLSDTGDNNVDVEETPEQIKADAEKMMKTILNDPLIKKAFYKQPSLWNMIISAAKGENSRGTGIGPAKNILHKYGEDKIRKILGPNGNYFKVNKPAQFEVLYNDVLIKPSGNPKDILKLSQNVKYDAIVNSYELGGDEHLTLTNKRLGIKIRVLKPFREVSDAFEVTIIKSIKNRNTGEISEYPKAAIIKFNSENGSGYVKTATNKTEPNKTK